MNTEQIQIKLVDSNGAETGGKAVSAEIFANPVKAGLLHQVVRWQRAGWRAGTHSVLTRATMSGGGTKPWRQKGTGRARAGSNTSPLWVGGGIAHGPKPRKSDFKLNRKEKKLALCGAISARNSEGRLIAIEDFGLAEIKTKQAQQVLNSIGVSKGKSALVVVPEGSDELQKSLRNIEGITVTQPIGVNVYDVLNTQYLVMVGTALDAVQSRLLVD